MAYLNRALTNFRAAVNARWPGRDKTSDGWIGDPAHQATTSDHNPDPDGSVDAWDMDVDGVDVGACIAAACAHESIQYVIYNRRITSRSWGLGVWRTYTGDNPHDKHVHFNTRSSHENSTAPWVIPSSGGSGMTLTPQDLVAIWTHDLVDGPDVGQAYKLVIEMVLNLRAVRAELGDLRAELAELRARPQVEAAPVDAGTLAAALADPAVRPLLVEAAREGAEAAEDS